VDKGCCGIIAHNNCLKLEGFISDQNQHHGIDSEDMKLSSDSHSALYNKMEQIMTTPIAKSFAAGAVSGTCSTLLLQPLDLMKTRIQSAAAAPSVTTSGHQGMIGICRNVLVQEKIVGLWKGTAASLWRCVPGVGLYFCSLQTLRSTFGSSSPSNAELVSVGAAARCVSGAAMLPFTVVKVRFESGKFAYGGVMKALKSIYRVEGTAGLYSGMAATLARDAPFSGIYLLFYTNTKKLVNQEDFEPSHIPLVHFSCGILSGILASVVTQPADVVKTHMQICDSRSNKTLTNTAKAIYQADGLRGFMSGIVPRTLRRAMMAALAWTLYEQVTRKLGMKSG